MFSNRKKFKIQGKTAAHKKSLIRSQVTELIRTGRIKTTPTKARVIKKHFDKVVTKYKKNTDHAKRQVTSFFGNNERAVKRFSDVVEQYLSDRNSGYTRVIKTLPRKGDNAAQAYIMLVNYEVEAKKSKVKELLEKRKEAKTKDKETKK